MTRIAISTLLLFLLSPAIAQAATPCATYDDCYKMYVPYVQYAEASGVCDGLPEESLMVWLTKEFGTGAAIQWDVNDCGERPDYHGEDAEADYPVCVGVEATYPDGCSVYLNFIAGTDRLGPTGPVELYDADIESLCDLPEYLGEP